MMKKVSSVLQKVYIGIIFAFLYAPVVLMIVLSFNGGSSDYKWGGFSTVKYEALFSNESIMDALVTTVILALAAAAIATILGTIACVGLLAMKPKMRSAVTTVSNIPLLNADIVTGVALMLFFTAFVTRMSGATLLISHVTLVLPYVILNVLPKLMQFDVSIYHAALDLGASPVKAFFKVVLPDIFPGLLAGFLLALTISLDDFTITYFTAGPGLETLSTNIYNSYRIRGIIPEYYALSAIMFVGVLLLILVMQIVNLRSQARLPKGKESHKKGNNY